MTHLPFRVGETNAHFEMDLLPDDVEFIDVYRQNQFGRFGISVKVAAFERCLLAGADMAMAVLDRVHITTSRCVRLFSRYQIPLELSDAVDPAEWLQAYDLSISMNKTPDMHLRGRCLTIFGHRWARDNEYGAGVALALDMIRIGAKPN